MRYAQTRIYLCQWDAKNCTNRSPNTDQKTRRILFINKKKRTCHRKEFTISTDYWMIIKEIEKINKYLNFMREQKNNLKHRSDIDTNCSCRHRSGHSERGKQTGWTGDHRENETLQTTALLKSAWVLESKGSEETCYHSDSFSELR